MTNPLYFYRLATWGHKINGLRVALYPLFACALVGRLTILSALFTLAIVGLLMASYAVNDYYDWQLLGEKNFMSKQYAKGERNKRRILLLSLLPVLLCIPYLCMQGWFLDWCLVATALVSFWYSAPPLRLKIRRYLGVVVPPLVMVFVFIQSAIVAGLGSSQIVVFSTLLILFQSFAECLHMFDDTLVETEHEKLKKKSIMRFATVSNILYIVISMYFIHKYSVVFIASLIAGCVRIRTSVILSKKTIASIRSNVWRFEWFLYEFIVYGLLGFLGVFKV